VCGANSKISAESKSCQRFTLRICSAILQRSSKKRETWQDLKKVRDTILIDYRQVAIR